MMAVEAVGFGIDNPNTRYASWMKRTCRMMRLPRREMISAGGNPRLRGLGICLDDSE